jgi:hypothetical protein
MASLTAHIMVRNEPFVAYAIRSVYDYVDKIMVWDTGSSDDHTHDDITDAVFADRRGKISAKFVLVDVDETRWTTQNWHAMRAASRGKYTKGVVRKEMIDATETDWFMIVDGDEVHYNQTMEAVRSVIDHTPLHYVCLGLPLLWLDTMKTYFRRSVSGRVFRTDAVGMITLSPNEMHTVKATGQPLVPENAHRVDLHVKPYAHFEKVLKPWRRQVSPDCVQPYRWALPQVMRKDLSIVQRFFAERKTRAD